MENFQEIQLPPTRRAARFHPAARSVVAVAAVLGLAGGPALGSALLASPAYAAAPCFAPRHWHVVITHRPGYGNEYTLVCS